MMNVAFPIDSERSMASVDREIMELLLHDARRWIFMVPRRAGECNEGILV